MLATAPLELDTQLVIEAPAAAVEPMDTRLVDRNNFLLVKTGFRFVQEAPFNR